MKAQLLYNRGKNLHPSHIKINVIREEVALLPDSKNESFNWALETKVRSGTTYTPGLTKRPPIT